MTETLFDIGARYGTDKSHGHKFNQFYDKFLSKHKETITRVMEIGIYQSGASIRMWHDYFPNAHVYGVDIVECPPNLFDSNRITTIVANQENEEQLKTLPEDLDLFIDDGGHTMLQQQITLKVMIDKIKSGGFYILEDLHTCFPEWGWTSFGATHTNNTIRLLSELRDKKKSEESNFFISDEDFYSLCDKIESIDIVICSQKSITSLIVKK